jgi:outer membrane protein assembly factor BamB
MMEVGVRGWSVGALVLGVLLWGCAPSQPRPLPRLASEAGLGVGRSEARWQVVWGGGVEEARVSASPGGGVWLEGQRGGARVLARIEPETGAILWERRLEGLGRGAGPLEIGERVVVGDGGAVVGLEAGSGEEAWRFAPPEGGIYRVLEGEGALKGRLWVNVRNLRMVELEVGAGRVVGEVALDDDPVAAVVAGAGGAAWALVFHVGPAHAPTLQGLSLERGEVGWSLPIEVWEEGVEVVGGVAVGELAAGELWAVEPGTGELLWRQPKHALGGRVWSGGERLLVTEAGLPSTLAPEAEEAPPEGRLGVRGIDPRRGVAKEGWRAEVPTSYDVAGIEAIGESGEVFGATLDRLFVLEEREGRLQWTYHLSYRAAEGLWSNATCDGEAVYVVFGDPGGARLQRIPVLPE